MTLPRIIVSEHALQRYRERIGAGSDAEALAVLTGPAVACAAAFGARVVRMARGRIILEHGATGVRVITVLRISDRLPHQLLPGALGGPAPIAFAQAFQPPFLPAFPSTPAPEVRP